LCGLYLSLGPTLQESVFGVRNGALNGISIATLCGAAALAPTLLNGIPTRMVQTCGIFGLMAGLAVLMIALLHRTPWLFFLGTAIAGSGLGAAFSGLVQTLAPLADVHERAELFAAIYVASYLSLSFPPIVAGFLSVPLGLIVTVCVYFLILLAFAILGLLIRPAISLSSTT
jgi:MFS family permease